MSTPVVIALGGNQGDVRSVGHTALSQLGATPGIQVTRVSRWYSTEPVGCVGEFLNAAALLSCEISPPQLLKRLHEIEAAHGRVRSAHWGPRPLDLDIVLFGTQQYDSPSLVIPHPWVWNRRFVLDPACEIAGEMLHSGLGLTLHQLRERLRERPLRVAWSGPDAWSEFFDHTSLARFQQQIERADEPASAHLHFTTDRQTWLRPFEVLVPANRERAQALVALTLTAMLDEPRPV